MSNMMMRGLIVVHLLLMLLASTGFTIVTGLTDNESLQWCYYHIALRSGFGPQSVSEFSPAVILTYLVSFAFGLAGFTLAFTSGRTVAGLFGIALSVIGLASFAIEGSHWMIDHHRSCMAFSPLLMFVLSVVVLIPHDRRPAQLHAAST